MSGNKHTSSKSVVSLFQLRLDLWGLISKKTYFIGSWNVSSHFHLPHDYVHV